MGSSVPLEISVLLATRGRAELVGRALDSLAEQTLAQDRFEVVVVVNGTDEGGTAAAVDDVRERHPGLRVRVARSVRPGVAHARSLALEMARGRHMTIVDDDDSASPHFLEDLLAAASPGVVPLAWLAEAEPDAPHDSGTLDLDNYYSRALRRALDRARAAGATGDVVVHAEEIPQAISLNVGKLLPTALARAVGYDWDLWGGSDFVFWTKVFARSQFSFRILPDERAHYVRTRSPASLSRGGADRGFAVDQRLACIGSLEAVAPANRAVGSVVRHVVRAQLGHVRRYLEAHPEERPSVVEVVEERALRRVDWAVVNGGSARDLALLYCFTPWVGTAGIVAARRLRERGLLVDVVCKDLDGLRDRDPSLELIAAPYVARSAALEGPAHFSSWEAAEDWTRRVHAQLEAWGTDHRSVYSRAMWLPSHLAAAQVKLRNPSIRWVAEFSDPISRTVRGRPRPGAARPGPLLDELAAGIAAAGHHRPDHLSAFAWAEDVAFALADEVLFTNENQRDYMLSLCRDPALAERARSVATVSHHPTLPSRFYRLRQPDHPRSPDTVHLAYFGAFYPTRGLTEVTGALHRLAPEDRRRVRLHVFTQDPESIAAAVHEADLADVVHVGPYADFLDFLALTTLFDVLVVNDADTREHGSGPNPYLPSKLSDYLGSGTPIWAIVEPGSVMAGAEVAHRTRLGDVEGARAVLEALARTAATDG